MIHSTVSLGGQKDRAAMDTAANKAIARRYFSEMVDKRSDKLLEELWTEIVLSIDQRFPP